MTCSRCNKSFEPDESGACPHCGEKQDANKSGIVRTSAILIAAEGDRQVYRSVEEVPPKLRRKLLQSTSSLTSGTILIADRKGRQELSRALRRLSPSPQHRALRTALGCDSPAPAPLSGRVIKWIGLLLAVLCLGFVWLVFSRKW